MNDQEKHTVLSRKILLLEKGVNLAAIARDCGWSRQYIYNVLNGRLWPSSRVIAAVAAAVGLPPDEFRRRYMLTYHYRKAA